jgi:VWFA-related protein
MLHLFPRWILVPILSVAPVASAQVLGIPTGMRAMDEIEMARMQFNTFLIGSRDPHSTSLQTEGGSSSMLDVKAPRKAKREYVKGYGLLLRKDWAGAVSHLQKAVVIYPKYVSAHNALGTALLDMGQGESARNEFAVAVALDGHLPNTYLNLGCAELALKHYPEAEGAFQKAASIAPLDNQLQLALAYAAFENRDFPAVIATSRDVHGRKHEGSAIIHFFAAGAWEAQGNFIVAEREMEVLLNEDPKSPYVDQFRQILDQIKAEQARATMPRSHPGVEMASVSREPGRPTQQELDRQRQFLSQEEKERKQIAEAEGAPNPACIECDASGPETASLSPGADADGSLPRATFRVSADEVSVFFAATDRGLSVSNLAASDVAILDDGEPPSAILGFRDESQLPLRLGLVVDISDSVSHRLSFEKAAAIRFLQRAVVDPDDEAFVVGVDNSVLLVQDFTPDQTLTARAVNGLAAGGGTALWDAVAFAARKLANRQESRPVARVLVVLSDGEDNSSIISLKQAIAGAQRGEVAVYTVSTQDSLSAQDITGPGDHALQTLSGLTGGAALVPHSVSGLDRSLTDLQEIIRSRYLISYKPASFERNDRYRTISIEAQKAGHKLTIFARRGYFASAALPTEQDR